MNLESTKLKRVTYRAFESDFEWLAKNAHKNYHEIDGEIILYMEKNEVFVSWVSFDEHFNISVGTESYFNNKELMREFDASNHPFWVRLIGSRCSFSKVRGSPYALEISSNNHSLYICAYEDGVWGKDTVYISPTLPPNLPERLIPLLY